MKNKYLLIIFTIFFTFCFIILFKGLKNTNIYKPKFNQNQVLNDFASTEFFSNEKIKFSTIISDEKYYLINIWASWCIPCRKEHKFLNKFKREGKIILIGINYKDKFKNAKKFLNDFGNPYQIIFKDKNGIVSIELGAYGVPETFLINKNFEIIKKIIGPINQKTYNEIAEIIK